MCTPGFWKNVGYCCLVLSIWAVLQLGVMGIFYYIEAVPLVEDVAAKKYNSYDEYIFLTTLNFKVTAMNCWIAAVIYVVTGVLSIFGIIYASQKQKEKIEEEEDDEAFCEPPEEPGGPKPKRKYIPKKKDPEKEKELEEKELEKKQLEKNHLEEIELEDEKLEDKEKKIGDREIIFGERKDKKEAKKSPSQVRDRKKRSDRDLFKKRDKDFYK
ncbi:hypothetical protein ABMA27_005963 [Loxostege sticticalis]|uniref:Uncharacterized protein n=1 Tax=Loxostege sticticalis TaxID=481309 RepID=A0ABR3HHG1_LOXSC